MSHTYDQPKKQEQRNLTDSAGATSFKLPKKLLVQQARKDDVVLPPRTQLHIDPSELDNDIGEHDIELCIHCQAEMGPDYGVDENGFCYVVGPNPPFIPR